MMKIILRKKLNAISKKIYNVEKEIVNIRKLKVSLEESLYLEKWDPNSKDMNISILKSSIEICDTQISNCEKELERLFECQTKIKSLIESL